jgi:hypothetical protein
MIGIEGLEFNRRLTADELNETDDINNLNNTTQIRTKKSKTKKTSSTSYLSKKIFFYTDLNNRTEIISSFRSGKFAPKRPVEGSRILNQLITIDKKITNNDNFKINDKNSSTNNVKKNDNIQTKNSNSILKQKQKFGKFIAEIEFPNGRLLKTEKISITRNKVVSFSLLDVLFSSNFNELGVQYDIINFVRGKAKKPFNKWISFASNSDTSGRSQEYYTLSKEKIKLSFPFKKDMNKFKNKLLLNKIIFDRNFKKNLKKMNFKNDIPNNNIDGLISENFLVKKSDLEKQIDLENEELENFQSPGICMYIYLDIDMCVHMYLYKYL